MNKTAASPPPSKAEQDFRTAIALEFASLHVKAAADSRLKAALEKLRQARDEIAALKAEKRALTKKLETIEKAEQERQKSRLTDVQREQRMREIFGLAPKEELESLKARQEAKREGIQAH
ncbi:MAG: hypothetical protein C5B50_27395 [Verrucomicrobia bacterium]|nr:MAG: hypothetical protein C5B50_27395 [Verrucomicrobiota bacterium]